MIVSKSETFVVGDHDYTRFSLIPSIVLVVDILDSSKAPGTQARCTQDLRMLCSNLPVQVGMQLNSTTYCSLRLEQAIYYSSIQMEGQITG